jgi:FkbM family methyltransferase
MLDGGILFVELDDGSRYYAQPDGPNAEEGEKWARRINYKHPSSMAKIKLFRDFLSFFAVLIEQYVYDEYLKYYELKRGDVVVDVGAHIGVFCVRASRAVGEEGKVLAIEPDPSNLELLNRNIRANSVRNVVVIGKAVYGRRGRERLYLSPHRASHSLYKQGYRWIEVEADTLDCILAGSCVKADFIKMDIEGAEVEALKGMNETLRKHVRLAIAGYHIVDGTRTCGIVAEYLRSRGFRVRVEDGRVYAHL